MRLTVCTDYSLRLLIYLSARQDRKPIIREVADAYGISVNYMTKVVHEVAQAGYVITMRGRSGGIAIGRPPSEIGLGEVVRDTEPDLDIAPCFDERNESCPLRRACRLKSALERARWAFLSVLDEYTLADLTVAPGPIRAMLGLSSGVGAGLS